MTGNKLASTAALTLVLALALAGCNRSLNSIAPRSDAPQRLPAAPVETVDQGQLPPPSSDMAATDPSALPQDPAQAPSAPTAPSTVDTPTETATAAPAPSGEPVTRESVSGAWIVASDNPDCRMILAFTKWSGGYRAATKRCTSAEVSSVSAWDVKGQQVVLMDSAGNTIARLYNSGGERFDGTTNGGNPIRFTR